jgi:hypothetical protein
MRCWLCINSLKYPWIICRIENGFPRCVFITKCNAREFYGHAKARCPTSNTVITHKHPANDLWYRLSARTCAHLAPWDVMEPWQRPQISVSTRKQRNSTLQTYHSRFFKEVASQIFLRVAHKKDLSYKSPLRLAESLFADCTFRRKLFFYITVFVIFIAMLTH